MNTWIMAASRHLSALFRDDDSGASLSRLHVGVHCPTARFEAGGDSPSS